jgi:hypothetical protein
MSVPPITQQQPALLPLLLSDSLSVGWLKLDSMLSHSDLECFCAFVPWRWVIAKRIRNGHGVVVVSTRTLVSVEVALSSTQREKLSAQLNADMMFTVVPFLLGQLDFQLSVFDQDGTRSAGANSGSASREHV